MNTAIQPSTISWEQLQQRNLAQLSDDCIRGIEVAIPPAQQTWFWRTIVEVRRRDDPLYQPQCTVLQSISISGQTDFRVRGYIFSLFKLSDMARELLVSDGWIDQSAIETALQANRLTDCDVPYVRDIVARRAIVSDLVQQTAPVT